MNPLSDPIPPGTLDPVNAVPPDFDLTIHWASRGSVPTKAFLSDKRWAHDGMAQMPIWVTMGAMAATISIGQYVLPRMGLRPAWTWTLTGLLSVIVLVFGMRFLRVWGRARTLFTAPNSDADPRYRVRVFGNAKALGAVHSAFDPGRDSGFDPAAYFAFFAVAPARRAFAWFWSAVVLVWLAWFGWQLATHMRSNIASLEMMGIAGVLASLWAACFPVYIRVSPGRAEVMRAGFLGRWFRVSESHDLRSLRVAVDANARVIYLSRDRGDGTDEPVARYAYRNVPRGAELAAMILQAAVCTARAPALPTDRL